MKYSLKKINTMIGELTLIACDNRLSHILFADQKILQIVKENIQEELHDVIKETEKQLKEYFQGKRNYFDMFLDLQGTEFQVKVWQNLIQIPYGKTISYKELASSCGSPDLARAVGSANARNPIPIIIPCHRVINKNSKLGGYAGGLEVKRKLLELEKGCWVLV